MREARSAFAALIAVAGFLVGVPIGNLATGGDPGHLLPRTLPDLTSPDAGAWVWQALRWSYLDGTLIPWLAHTLVWCGWAIGAVLILLDLARLLSAGSAAAARHLVGRSPRTWITSLVASALLVFSASNAVAEPVGPLAVATAYQHPTPAAPSPDPYYLPLDVRPECPRHQVVLGDTYWGLAEHHLGDGRRYVDIEALNHDRVPDPRDLLPGTILLLPPDATDLPTSAKDPGPGAYQVTVRVGQSLADIARSHQVTGGWQRLWEINRNRLQPDGRALRAPELILPGWQLWIPAPPPAPVAPPVVPPVASTAPPGPAPAPPPQAPRTTNGPSAPEATGATPDATRGHSPSNTASPGQSVITLPSGGIVGLGFAGLITIALAVARLRRRRHRHVTGTLHPPAPTPAVPPAVALLDTACRAPDPTQPADEPHTDPGTPQRAWPPPAPVLTAHDDNGTTATVDLSTVPGLGLTGPGASAAARAALIALLAADTLHPTELLIVADTATFLADGIGTAPAADGAAVADHVALGMTCVPTLDEAIAMVEAELARRTRLLDEHTLHATNPPDTAGENTADPDTPVADRLATYRASDPGESVPTYLVIASPPPPMAPRWLAVLELGRRLGIVGLLLGEWASSLYVAADGTVTTADTTATPDLVGWRLETLGLGEYRDVLSVVIAARGGPDHDAHHPVQDPPPPTPGTGDGGRIDPAPACVSGTRVRVCLFGRPRIEVDGQEVATGVRTLSRDLLAYLATTPAGAGADTLQEHLLARHSSTNGRAQIHTAVSHTRALLRTTTGCHTADFILTAAGRYRLDPALVTVDADAVSAALTAARRADHDADRIHALGPVVALCRAGTPLEAITGAWAEPVRESLRQQAIDALVRLARLVSDSDPDHAVEALSTAIGLDPYAEQLYQHLMRLHVRAGRPQAAHAAYRQLQARLADIDAEPDPATTAMLPAGRSADTDHHARRSMVP